MNKKILFVDDERAILKAIRRELFDSEYDLFFAESGEEALELLSKISVDMIVIDMIMPGMGGYELLKVIKVKYPLTIRIILSGYTDEKVVFKSIYNNLAKLYLSKPWKNDEFKKMIDGVFKTEELLKNEKVLMSIRNIEKLPTINFIYEKISRLIEEDNYDIDVIIKYVEKDMVLSGQILKIVNSAFYGLKVSSVKSAVLNLGLINLKTIILTSEVFDFENRFVKKEKLWQHANLTNKLIIILYKAIINKKIPEYYYTAGLLHDIGKVILLKNYSEEYDEVYRLIYEDENNDICSVEKKYFNVSHDEVGGYMLQWWNLPYPIVETALYHHRPMNSNVVNRELVAISHIADYYSWSLIGDTVSAKLDDEVFNYLNISKQQCKDVINEVIRKENNYGEI
ncbi:response regulator [Clostridium felsineum]|uniref:response regulator n=1 Tax=Clostridium felsineum TaxID=36839 RepID=UPI00098C6AAA|nr:response regulator [Clostridium felsineum]URZ18176.1 Regulator of RpoS [Clostridium felsineum DSM 794]